MAVLVLRKTRFDPFLPDEIDHVPRLGKLIAGPLPIGGATAVIKGHLEQLLSVALLQPFVACRQAGRGDWLI